MSRELVENEYTHQQSIRIPNGILHVGAPSFWLHCGREKWLTEWHQYFGPICLDARTGDPRKNQPGERSAFWRVATWWRNQGAKVVDGIGQWKIPPCKKIRYRQVGSMKMIAHDDETGPDILEMETGHIDDWPGDEPAETPET